MRGVNRHDQLYTLSEDVTNESEEGDAMRMVSVVSMLLDNVEIRKLNLV